jgi:hypothetical protein
VTGGTIPSGSADDWSREAGLARDSRKPAHSNSARLGALQRAYRLFRADARLTEYALERSNYHLAMHRHAAPPIPSGHTNVRTGLPGNQEAQPLQSLERLGPRDVTGQFHA